MNEKYDNFSIASSVISILLCVLIFMMMHYKINTTVIGFTFILMVIFTLLGISLKLKGNNLPIE